MSTTASDMEREDRNSKSAEVQAAPGTRSISVGKIMVRRSGIPPWPVVEGSLRGFSVSVVRVPVLCVVQGCLRTRRTQMCRTSLSPPLSWIWTSSDTSPAGNFKEHEITEMNRNQHQFLFLFQHSY